MNLVLTAEEGGDTRHTASPCHTFFFFFLAWICSIDLWAHSRKGWAQQLEGRWSTRWYGMKETGEKRISRIIILTFLDIWYGNRTEGTFLVGYSTMSVLASLAGLFKGWLVQNLINLSFAAPLEVGATQVGVSIEYIRPKPPQPLALIGSPGKSPEKLSILKTVFVCDLLWFLFCYSFSTSIHLACPCTNKWLFPKYK